MKKIAVFASGNGSNFQALVEAEKMGKLDAKISLLICDQPEAYVLKRASAERIPFLCVSPKCYSSKISYEQALLEQLNRENIDFILLAGYMRLIGPTLLQAYPRRIINIHPSLLPAFPGKDAVDQAVKAGVKVTGLTIHYVDEGLDTGQIIAQRAVEIETGDTRESIQKRIQLAEHQVYPAVVQQLLHDCINLHLEGSK